MKFALLSQPFVVAGYFVLGALIWFLVILLKSLLKWRSSECTPAIKRHRLLRIAVGFLSCGICLVFFFDSMYLRFSKVEVADDHIVLKYFWPRPSNVIPRLELKEVALLAHPKRRTELVVATGRLEHHSIVCTPCERDDLENLQKAIAPTLKQVHE